MSSYVLKIVDDPSKFQDRVDEITAKDSFTSIKHAAAQVKSALLDNKDVVALCAPQVGLNLRLFGVKTANNKVKIFLNPLIISGEGLHLSRETNASFRNKQFIIPRKDKVHVAYQEINGAPNSETYSGVYGEVVQQMIEMLDGILLSDYGLDLDDVGGVDKFDKASKKDKEALIQMYLDSLKNISGNLKAEIDATPALKELDDTIEFMTGVLMGDIKPVDKDGNIIIKKSKEEEEEHK